MGITLTGNRAIVYVDGNLVGIFDSCNYTTNLITEDIFILGASLAQEIAIAGQEVINLNCSGFRVIGQGVHVLPKFPKVSDLMNFQSLTITVVDRQTGAQILTVLNCTPVNTGEGYNAKAVSKVTVSYKGIRAYDESGDSGETGAASLPV